MATPAVTKKGRGTGEKKSQRPGDRSVSQAGQSVDSSQFPMRPYPEWNEEEVTQEKFFLAPRTTSTKVEDVLFEDPDAFEMPAGIAGLVCSWKRPAELFGNDMSNVPMIVTKQSKPEVKAMAKSNTHQHDPEEPASTKGPRSPAEKSVNIPALSLPQAPSGKKGSRRRERKDREKPGRPGSASENRKEQVSFEPEEKEACVAGVDTEKNQQVDVPVEDDPEDIEQGWIHRIMNYRLLVETFVGPDGITIPENDPSYGLLRWISSQISILSQHRDVIEETNYLWELIYPKNKDNLPMFSGYGKYAIRLYLHGRWRRVLVDDRIPCDFNGTPLLVSASDKNQLWPLLLSKALLKVFSYLPRPTGSLEDISIIHWLSAWLPEWKKLKKSSAWDTLVEVGNVRKSAVDAAAQPLLSTRSRKSQKDSTSNLGTAVAGSPQPSPRAVALASNRSRRSTRDRVDSAKEDPTENQVIRLPWTMVAVPRNPDSLQERHAKSYKEMGLPLLSTYGVCGAKIARGVKMVCLFNPLASWSGRFSDEDSNSWMPSLEKDLGTTLEHRKKRAARLGYSTDFWMSYDDFCHFFDRGMVIKNHAVFSHHLSIPMFWEEFENPHRNAPPSLLYCTNRQPTDLQFVLHAPFEQFAGNYPPVTLRLDAYDWKSTESPPTVLNLSTSRMTVGSVRLPPGRNTYVITSSSARGCTLEIYSDVPLSPQYTRSGQSPRRTARKGSFQVLSLDGSMNSGHRASLGASGSSYSTTTGMTVDENVKWIDVGMVGRILKERCGIKLLEAQGDYPGPLLPDQWAIWFRMILKLKGSDTPAVLQLNFSDPVWAPLVRAKLVNNSTLEETSFVVGPLDGVLQTPLAVLDGNDCGHTIICDSRTSSPPPGPVRWTLRVLPDPSVSSAMSWENRGSHSVLDMEGVSTPLLRDPLLCRYLAKVRELTPCSAMVMVPKRPGQKNIRVKLELLDHNKRLASTEGIGQASLPVVQLRPTEREGRGKTATEIPHKFTLQASAVLESSQLAQTDEPGTTVEESFALLQNVASESRDETPDRSSAGMPALPLNLIASPGERRRERSRKTDARRDREGEKDGKNVDKGATMLDDSRSLADANQALFQQCTSVSDVAWRLQVAYPNVATGTAAPMPDLRRDTECEERLVEIKSKWEKNEPGRAKKAYQSREKFLALQQRATGVTTTPPSVPMKSGSRRDHGPSSARGDGVDRPTKSGRREKRDRERGGGDKTAVIGAGERDAPVALLDSSEVAELPDKDKIMMGYDDDKKEPLVLVGKPPVLRDESFKQKRDEERAEIVQEFSKNYDEICTSREAERGARAVWKRNAIEIVAKEREEYHSIQREVIQSREQLREELIAAEEERKKQLELEREAAEEAMLQAAAEGGDLEGADQYITSGDLRQKRATEQRRDRARDRQAERERRRKDSKSHAEKPPSSRPSRPPTQSASKAP